MIKKWQSWREGWNCWCENYDKLFGGKRVVSHVPLTGSRPVEKLAKLYFWNRKTQFLPSNNECTGNVSCIKHSKIATLLSCLQCFSFCILCDLNSGDFGSELLKSCPCSPHCFAPLPSWSFALCVFVWAWARVCVACPVNGSSSTDVLIEIQRLAATQFWGTRIHTVTTGTHTHTPGRGHVNALLGVTADTHTCMGTTEIEARKQCHNISAVSISLRVCVCVYV